MSSKVPILGSRAEVSKLLPPGHVQTTAGFCKQSFTGTEPLPLVSFVLWQQSEVVVQRPHGLQKLK